MGNDPSHPSAAGPARNMRSSPPHNGPYQQPGLRNQPRNNPSHQSAAGPARDMSPPRNNPSHQSATGPSPPHNGAYQQPAPRRTLDLAAAQAEVLTMKALTPLSSPLLFLRIPSSSQPFDPVRQPPVDIHRPNTGPYALARHKNNEQMLGDETRLLELLGLAETSGEHRHELQNQIYRRLEDIVKEKGRHWDHQRLQVDRSELVVYNGKSTPSPPDLVHSCASQIIILRPNCMRHARGGAVQLAGLRDLLKDIPGAHELLNSIPSDSRSIVKALRLDPDVVQYSSCLACHALKKVSEIRRDREICCFEETCNEPLTHELEVKDGPGPRTWRVRRIVYLQDFNSWLGRLLARPGIEQLLVDYPAKVMESAKPGGEMTDIWASPAVLKLRGPDGLPFVAKMRGKDPELRLLVAFAADGYNPFRNLTAKQNVKSQGLWFTILNFPPDMRYQFHNLFYYGSLPGPVPNVHQNVHILANVRDMLQKLYQPGLFFTSTHSYPLGRPAKAMLCLEVFDSPEARASMGFTSVTSTNFCGACPAQYWEIENCDISSWPPLRNMATHRVQAEAWKNANEKERGKLEDLNGVRYSPLLDLAYLDVFETALVEPMHAVDLNAIQDYCRKFLRIDQDNPGGDGSGPRMARPSAANAEGIQEAIKVIFHAVKKDLDKEDCVARILQSCASATYRNLWYFCEAYELRIAGHTNRRDWYVYRIVDWMKRMSPNARASFKFKLITSPRESLESIFHAAEIRLTERNYTLGLLDSDKLTDALNLLKRIYSGTLLPSALLQVYKDTACLLQLSIEGTRETLFHAILSHTEVSEDMEKVPARNLVKGKGPILGKDVLDVFHANMGKTIMPSFIDPVPKNWGTTARGKLSAANWRTLFLIHFPTELIWLWKDNERGGRMDEILHITLVLAEMVEIVGMKTTSPELAAQYLRCYEVFFSGILKLFRENQIAPWVHQLGHIAQNLKINGPSHSHQAQFYERHIHKLQETNTNNKPGQMQKTFLYSAARAANLMWALERDEATKSSVKRVLEVYNRDTKQTPEVLQNASMYALVDPVLNIIARSRWQTLEQDDSLLLREYQAQHRNDMMEVDEGRTSTRIMDQILIDQVWYAREGLSKRQADAHVIAQVGSNGAGELQAAIIHLIVQLTVEDQEKPETLLILKLFPPLNLDIFPLAEDPYRRWSQCREFEHKISLHTTGWLCDSLGQDSHKVVVTPEDIQGPFALTPRQLGEWQGIHARPVSRAPVSLLRWLNPQSGYPSDRFHAELAGLFCTCFHLHLFPLNVCTYRVVCLAPLCLSV
ncbi:hypothetical protein C8F01DRAFT_1309532 [Mycena amicta]|nr:hypothetical protein C8F01DRAFT_1309532 [Mycena amicta]